MWDRDEDEKKDDLRQKMQGKIISLQRLLLQQYQNPNEERVNPNDMLRYTAMIEVLEAMLR